MAKGGTKHRLNTPSSVTSRIARRDSNYVNISIVFLVYLYHFIDYVVVRDAWSEITWNNNL